ncbi:MAG: hypothetical protein ACTS53_02095 [Candidatus Hodgkinia cicadicola]
MNPNSPKYKVISATKVLQIRSEAPFGPFYDVLAKVTAVPDQVLVSQLRNLAIFDHFAINALRSNTTSEVHLPFDSAPRLRGLGRRNSITAG